MEVRSNILESGNQGDVQLHIEKFLRACTGLSSSMLKGFSSIDLLTKILIAAVLMARPESMLVIFVLFAAALSVTYSMIAIHKLPYRSIRDLI